MSTGYINFQDLPDNLLEIVTDRLHTHCTSLFVLPQRDTNEKLPLHIGAGTFLEVSGEYGILTATHAADKLVSGSLLGVLAAHEGTTHRFSVDRDVLSIGRVGQRTSDEYGPDMAFISLADWDKIGTIRASRAFHSPHELKLGLMAAPPQLDVGIWCVSGTPEERVQFENDQAGFQTVVTIEIYTAVGPVDRSFQRGQYDYLEFPISGHWENAPRDYSGMSGGSLWQVEILQTEEGRFEPAAFNLMGVAFYQGVRDDGTRYLRCHGPRTMYRELFPLIAKGCA